MNRIPNDWEHFWHNVAIDDGCWDWQGRRTQGGYGQHWYEGRHQSAHRLAWRFVNGAIPPGSGAHGTCVLHHRDNRRCVRPSHLWLGTNTDNQRDCQAKGRGRNPRIEANKLKTHCPNGHPYSGSNLYVIPSTRARACRACRVVWSAEQHARTLGRVAV